VQRLLTQAGLARWIEVGLIYLVPVVPQRMDAIRSGTMLNSDMA
jgi:hypothetical protein